MPIDIKVPGSDGWWVQRLSAKLVIQSRECDARYERYMGRPPLADVNPNAREAVQAFLKKASANFERLIVGAVLSRLRIIGLRTPNQSDADGDQVAWERWVSAGMPLVMADVLKMRLAMSVAYVIVGLDQDGDLLVTAEDPRQVIAEVDPANPTKVRAALKMYHDEAAEEDVAFLYINGRVRVATSPRKARIRSDGRQPAVVFIASRFDWADSDILDKATGEVLTRARSGDLPGLEGMNPVVPFENEDGVAEFEPFLSILDRINEQILDKLTIIKFQAFKQRAVKGMLDKDPKTGQKYDYDDVLTADPGSVWILPPGGDVWESSAGDVSTVMLSIRDDVKDLAASSFTPLYSITPDAANGSAEGASSMREGQVFKVESHQDRLTPPASLVAELIARVSGDPLPVAKAQIIWAPAERFSLSERGSAAAQLKGIVPTETIWTEVMQYPPEMIARLKTQRADDMVLAEQLALASAAQVNVPTVQPASDQSAVPAA